MALMPVADALNSILDGIQPLPAENVALDDALHRTLARDVAARRTQPPAPMSAMDGYAVRTQDALAGARLTVTGESAAGRPCNLSVGQGEAIRIFTGGVVPNGADTIAIQEDVVREGNVITLSEAVPVPRHVRKAGLDFHEGDILLKRGTRLSDRDLSLAASMNHPTLPVHRKPKIAIVATGDELVMPGMEPNPGQIIYSNAYAINALVRNSGAETINLGIARDTLDDTRAAIRRAEALGADIIITTGGASVGEHDLVKPSFEAEGIDIKFWKIALRPGKPMMHGRKGAMSVIGLPGNPSSSYVCSFVFVVPLIRALLGRAHVAHCVETAILGHDLPANDHRQEYMRARIEINGNGVAVATTVDHQDSSLLNNLSAADVLLIRPPLAPPAPAGARCDIIRLPS
ncbi:molybdopterin molybdotransferase MoeA [[Pseudomonas] carboxydohydrogena]|uniref:Molybdopterin molybdenumtransferase n=1 Tax=Afipia carboxydohydrogena TaxID=290 RepID=A0ABY8BSW7_AFICR|nr:gephyrin-like molybdotransferase Glp [[Pseudomonas] carboxydohydrogena]WEF53079.1 molybdopterin molybdotransferase MoeA [[Pseudomonas] carboxydohydrogena]